MTHRLLLLLLLLLPGLALAQDASKDKDAEKEALLPSPSYRIISFEDIPGSPDCDPLAARFGACIEEVRFLSDKGLWEPRRALTEEEADDDELQLSIDRRRNVLSTVSRLHAYFWEDLAYRWNRSGDGVESTLKAAGFEALPPPARAWQPGYPEWRRVQSLPPAKTWLGAGAWAARETGQAPKGKPQLFRRVRTVAPKGIRNPRSATLMKGRFALRLGFNGRQHPYDVMDASAASSGPFFEQMVPFIGAMESEDERIRPLLHLSSPPQLTLLAQTDARGYVSTEKSAFAPVLLEAKQYIAFRQKAAREFELFRRSIGLHIVRFGLEEHTINQMRVLGALTAMERPPGWKGRERTQMGRDLVAAARGETDRLDDVEALINRKSRILDTGVRIQFGQLDQDIIDRWLERPPAAAAPAGGSRDMLWEIIERPPDALLTKLNEVVIGLYGELLDVDPEDLERNAKTYQLHSVTEPALVQWASTWLKAGIDPQPIVREIRHIALEKFVGWLTDDPALDPTRPGLSAKQRREVEAARDARLKLRDELETWLLLDAVSESLGAQFDPAEGKRVTPGQVAEASRSIWSQVLLSHGYLTEPISQGLNAVDPLSVCTTLDKTEALDQPSFGAINVDLLVAASDGQTRVGRVLWEARDQIPFLLLDDPMQEPEMVRLVGLPGDKALYRLRYRVWSGWHVLWTPEPLTQVERDEENRRNLLVPNPDVLRLGARTAAFCTDMVLADHDLVPTLVRAAMLDGEFRPTRPVMPGDAKDYTEEKAREYKDAQTVLEEAQAAGTEASAKTQEVLDNVAAVKEGGVEGAAALAEGALSGADASDASGIEYTEVTARVQYLRDIVHPPLRRLAGDDAGLLIAAFDVEHVPRKPLDDRPARTPYRRIQQDLPGGDAVRTAGWGWWVPETDAEPFGLLSPGYRSGNSVGSASAFPRWRRGSIADGWLTVGAAFSPFRQADYCRETLSTDQDVVENSATRNQCVGKAFLSDTGFTPPTWQSLRSEALGIDISGLLAIWGLGEPRVAFEVGGEVRLDVGHRGRSWFYSDLETAETGVTFQRPWTFRPAVGFLVGLRAMPLPALSDSGRTGWPWGSVRPDGRAPLSRGQLGIRGGLLFGPGFNGTEATAVAEFWGGGSIRRRFGPRRSFSPYQPASILGPFIRGQFGFQMAAADPGSTRNLRLVGSVAVLAGIRLQLRMTAPGKPETPEAPAAPAVEAP